MRYLRGIALMFAVQLLWSGCSGEADSAPAEEFYNLGEAQQGGMRHSLLLSLLSSRDHLAGSFLGWVDFRVVSLRSTHALLSRHS